MSIAEVADELYSLSPAEFTAAREERAREVRAAGQRETAAAIKKLARPTASAWLVNQLARQAPEEMNRLFEVGQALHEAQRTLAGDRLRELSARRRQVVADLLPVAARLADTAGQPASPAVLGEVRATLEAALADPQAGEAVRSGRLTKALAYAGLGEVDLTAALALPAEPTKPAAAEREHEDEDEKAARLIREAQAAADAAQAALDAAESQVAVLGEQRQFLGRRIDHLNRELTQAKAEDAQLARDIQQAQRTVAGAARDLESARQLVAKASKRATRRGAASGGA
jgi:hypothetical protein